jgi:hypothetical protein
MEKVIDKLRKEIEQTRQEAQRLLEICKGQLLELSEIQQFIKEEITEKPRISVPENIKFEWEEGHFRLFSPNGKSTLSASYWHGGVPLVFAAGEDDNAAEYIENIHFYLEPCKREDLKCGDVAYVCEENIEAYDLTGEIESYLVVLNNTHCVCWSDDSDMLNDNHDYDFWYKVIR